MSTKTIAQLPLLASVSPSALFEVDWSGVSSAAALAVMAASCDAQINVKALGGGLGNDAADTAAILAAIAAAEAATSGAHIKFPPGQYVFDNATGLINSQTRTVITGRGATILFKRAGVLQLGDGSHTESLHVFEGVNFAVDPGSTAVAPISLYNTGRTTFVDCDWAGVVTSGIDLRSGVVVLRGCNPSMSSTGTCFVHAAIPNTLSGAIFIQGGRYDGNTGQYVVDQSGQGQIDGLVLFGASVSGFGHVARCAPVSPGHTSNVVAVGNLLDGVDQQAFQFSPGSGAQINDVMISGNKINGSGTSTATSGALVTFDLSAGGTHGPYPFVVTGNVFANPRRRAFEVLAGAYSRVIFRGNTVTEYGTSANAASRGVYIDTGATFDMLEIADNSFTTSYTHDYGVEIGAGVTAPEFKVQGNAFSGTAANFAKFNTTRFYTVRTVLQADRTYYVDNTNGSDSNAGQVAGTGGAFKTLAAAWAAIVQLDLNGHNVTVQLADGTYTGGLTATNVPLGQGTITFAGNNATPDNVLVSTTSASCYNFPTGMAAIVVVKDQKLTTTTSGTAILVSGPVTLQWSNIDFGACASGHVTTSGQGAFANATGNYTISGGTTQHLAALAQSRTTVGSKTITITGTPAFTNFALANRYGYVAVTGLTFSGSATGQRYTCTRGGMIDTNTDTGSGANTTYLPGNASGVTSPGGLYY